MTNESSPEPLHRIISRMRHPATMRELMAACLRSIYMGDPFSKGDNVTPSLPQHLIDEVSAKDLTIAGVRCTIYEPVEIDDMLPAIVYMHGGGFVVGCSEDTDYITRMLCHSNKVIVASINYRLAPETVFPGALNDCKQVLESIVDNAERFKIDNSSIYLGGDSAGGNLAIALYQQAHEQQAGIKGLILLAPWLDMEVEKYDSYNRLAPTGIVFDSPFLGYARAAYVGFEQWRNPLVSPIHCAFEDLPPTIVLIGNEDPFVDQVTFFQSRAIENGCHQLFVHAYPGMPHCFYSFPGLFREEEECYRTISEFLRRTSNVRSN